MNVLMITLIFNYENYTNHQRLNFVNQKTDNKIVNLVIHKDEFFFLQYDFLAFACSEDSARSR